MLDLSNLRLKKPWVYTAHYSYFPRSSQPAEVQEPPPESKTKPKPARKRAARVPKPKPERHKDEYEPTSEEIEAHKQQFRERHRSEMLKPS